MHDIEQIDILSTIIFHTRIMVHQSYHQRACRTALDSRLVVGSCIGEVLAIEHIVGIGKDRPHLHRFSNIHGLIPYHRVSRIIGPSREV